MEGLFNDRTNLLTGSSGWPLFILGYLGSHTCGLSIAMRDGRRDDGIEGQPIAAFSVLADIPCPVRMMTSGVAAVLRDKRPDHAALWSFRGGALLMPL